jgi:hypothetical protein
MKKIVLFALVACAVSFTASAQKALTYTFETKASPDQVMQIKVGSPHLAMAFETKAVPNAPYQGEATTESVITLADGNRIVKKTTTRVYRDSAGRTRRETVDADGQVTSVFISDPVGKTNYALDPASQTAKQTTMYYAVKNKSVEPAGGGTVSQSSTPVTATWTVASTDATGAIKTQEIQKSVIVTAGQGGVFKIESLDSAKGDVEKEDLGEQNIEGVMAKGTRTTTTIPAGAVDNEQPIRIVSEEWFSPELQVLVLTRHSDPRVGETTYRLVNVSRTEPAKSLFELPAGYTIKMSESGTQVEVIKK